ncbi:MAG: 5-aminolevulinate synthase [Rhodobacteraceae bacterium]|nr:5-aminolevulinate synthase [Paracoccaceae bacterium]
MGISLSNAFFLIPLSALAYAVATVGIKMASGNVTPVAVTFIVCGFALAAIAEAILLQRSDLGTVYLAVLAVETLAILCFASLIGEGLSGRQFAGAVMVLGGIALVGSH